MSDVEVPEELRYTAEHEWVAPTEGGVVRIGITAYAQGELGDIVYVSLPAVGDRVEAGSSCGELESTKSVSELYAPVTGEVTARNDSLDGSPELVNSDPYGEGWVLEVRLEEAAALDGLLDAAGYRDHIS
jgi:glycine cleavage system H protein